MSKLYENIKGQAYELGIQKSNIPQYIQENIKYKFFDWQKKALDNFLTYQEIKKRGYLNEPTHLMFNMATGTGKTLLMAAIILYYYKQGYRHFLFFVNQNNIVNKTENNFLHNEHTKYLYKDKIVIDDKTVDLKKVDVFSDYPQGIEIKFTTIQKLYNDIHLERENQVTLDQLQSKDIVMLADEGHHLNTNTKKLGQMPPKPTEITGRTSTKEIERKGWEHTVIELILKKDNKFDVNKNVLLEFTATIPNNEFVQEKYKDKIIYKFDLKEFLQAGYTKEINLIASTLGKRERILQALLFNWYRHKIALKYNIPNFKAVILFRSKTIEESKKDYQEFLTLVDNLTVDDFEFLDNISKHIQEAEKPHLFEMGRSRTEKMLKFIKDNENISYAKIVDFIRNSFQDRNIIITNSKSNNNKIKEKTDEQTDKLLNSLEDKSNHIRAIFTVNRLTEGWDVLNLFDIVRLYTGTNYGSGSKKTPKATIQEKQLIGRGVRYYPFDYKNTIKNKRKFDDDLDHDLRILEELYYYTYDEKSRYIYHLKNELRKDGYISDGKIAKKFNLKADFKKSSFYKDAKIWQNKKKKNPNRRKKTLNDIKKDFISPYFMKGLEVHERGAILSKKGEEKRLDINKKSTKTIEKKFKDIEKHIFWKAINIKSKKTNSLLEFSSLQKELDIDSIEDLQDSKFLGDYILTMVVTDGLSYEDIDNLEKVNMVARFLDEFFIQFKKDIIPEIGTKDFYPKTFEEIFGEGTIKTVHKDEIKDKLIVDKEWYILDSLVSTDQEEKLVEFIENTIGNLEEKYDQVYLLRNEEEYKIYDFERGRGFQPDFLLFLVDKNKGKKKSKGIYYQVFIEPKGKQYRGNSDIDSSIENEDKVWNTAFKNGKEAWKEKFLKQITDLYGKKNIINSENSNYKLIGLPFFNQEYNSLFKEKYNELIK